MKETVTFGGNGNTITFENTSDVNVRAGEKIVIGSGTTIKGKCFLLVYTNKIPITGILQEFLYRHSVTKKKFL